MYMMCTDARNVRMRYVLSNPSEISFLCCLFPSVQIINKIKKHNDPNVTGDIEDVCDRIFDLVDKNKDSKL